MRARFCYDGCTVTHKSTVENAMKLGIVVGHTNKDKGASSPTLGQQEYTWNGDLAQKIFAVTSDIERKVFFRDAVGIAGAYKACDVWGAQITVELHFNSADTIKATGTGILYLAGSPRGKRLAEVLFTRINAVLGLGDWPKGAGGAITPFMASGKEMRGQLSLTSGKAPATLIEPFFGSNPSDCTKASTNKTALAGAIVKAAEDWFKG